MGGHMQIGDREKIEGQRQREMAEVLRLQRVERWPRPCPTCLQPEGEACLSRNGKRAREHQARS